jgi:hypothetical protein
MTAHTEVTVAIHPAKTNFQIRDFSPEEDRARSANLP